MRTNIVLDDDLVAEAMKVSGARTRKEVVHQALQHLVRSKTEARRRETYIERLKDIEKRTAGLVFRESARDLIRADRDSR